MVNGVLASCYASFHHDLAHIAMTPIRWFPEIMLWIFGEDDGFLAYIRINEELGQLITP